MRWHVRVGKSHWSKIVHAFQGNRSKNAKKRVSNPPTVSFYCFNWQIKFLFQLIKENVVDIFNKMRMVKTQDRECYISLTVRFIFYMYDIRTSSQAPSYASPKLWQNHSLTGVRCRATSVAKNSLELKIICFKRNLMGLLSWSAICWTFEAS